MTPPLVLLVDDFADNRELFAESLEMYGFRVTQAATGAEALAELAREVPAVILMDVTLPDIDGWEATRRIKSDARTASVPVIMLTGRPRDETAAEAKVAGCAGLLTKPVLPEAVVAEIRRVLG